MEFLNGHSSPASSIKVEQKTEPSNLLEQGWFFGNFLEKKPKMSRCYSDPNPYSNPTQDIQSSFSSKKKIIFSSSKDHIGGDDLRLNKPNSRPTGLLRAPSLPPCIGKMEVNFEEYYDDDDDDYEESDFTMGRLIRQASLDRSDVLPTKMMKPRRNSEADAGKTTSRDYSECKHDVQCCREMGFNFQKLSMNPGKGQGRIEAGQEGRRKSGGPRLPSWGVEKQNSTDMKAQIKFWARAVATNVRQEC